MNILHNTLDRFNRWTRKNQGKILIVVLAIWFIGMVGEDDYQRAKESEQLVASFWTADGSRHYSGREELNND